MTDEEDVEIVERTKKCEWCDGKGYRCSKCNNGTVDVITVKRGKGEQHESSGVI